MPWAWFYTWWGSPIPEQSVVREDATVVHDSAIPFPATLGNACRCAVFYNRSRFKERCVYGVGKAQSYSSSTFLSAMSSPRSVQDAPNSLRRYLSCTNSILYVEEPFWWAEPSLIVGRIYRIKKKYSGIMQNFGRKRYSALAFSRLIWVKYICFYMLYVLSINSIFKRFKNGILLVVQRITASRTNTLSCMFVVDQ